MTLFVSSFLASTILPGGSEAVLVYSLMNSDISAGVLLLTATIGNTLGGLSSWLIGWWLNLRFPLSGLDKPEHRRALERIRRFGAPVLLASWVPLIGDPLCVAAGWARISFVRALLFIALGKALRYSAIVLLVD